MGEKRGGNNKTPYIKNTQKPQPQKQSATQTSHMKGWKMMWRKGFKPCRQNLVSQTSDIKNL